MNIPKAIFLVSCAAIVFACGLVVGAYEVFPYKQIRFAVNSLQSVLAERDSLLSDKPAGFIAPRRYDGDGVTVFEPQRVAPGFTLLSGFFDDLPGLRLVRADGTVLASWPAAYGSLFPDTAHIQPKTEVPAGDWNAAVHGMEIEPDGSVVFNFDTKGTVKLDRCGNTVWTLAHMTHHSIDRAADGSYWIPSRYYVDETADYPLFKPPYYDDTLLHVAASGEVLSETPMIRTLIDNGLYSLLVANGRFPVRVEADDILHVNDIEELTARAAAAFDLFAAGDLLVSMRHLNLVLVLEPGSWRVKWYQVGPWLRQHDPDFQPDGTITVFDNNSDDTKEGELFQGSRIVRLRPSAAGQSVDTVYGDRPGQRFFTNTQGKHQFLPNGNLLIAEYYGGRAFEVDPSGEIVWEYINQYDNEHLARVSGARRYPAGYFTVTDWSCPAS